MCTGKPMKSTLWLYKYSNLFTDKFASGLGRKGFLAIYVLRGSSVDEISKHRSDEHVVRCFTSIRDVFSESESDNFERTSFINSFLKWAREFSLRL